MLDDDVSFSVLDVRYGVAVGPCEILNDCVGSLLLLREGVGADSLIEMLMLLVSRIDGDSVLVGVAVRTCVWLDSTVAVTETLSDSVAA